MPGAVEHRDPAGERLEVVAQHRQLVLVLRDRRSVGALAPLDDDVGDHVERARPRVHLLRDDLILVRARRRGTAARRRARARCGSPSTTPRCCPTRRDAARASSRCGPDRSPPRPTAARSRRRSRRRHPVAGARTRRRRSRCRSRSTVPTRRSSARGVSRSSASRNPTNGVSTRSSAGVARRAEPRARRVVHDAEPRVGCRGRVEDRAGLVGRRVVDEDRRPSRSRSARAASRARPPPTAPRRSPGR